MRARSGFALCLTLGFLGLGLSLLALQRPSPLFVNFGAGDGPFARGFRGGWERDGLRGSGETMFHWTADGSRVELPFAASGELTVRLRIARFANDSADLKVLSGGEVVDHWTQPPMGWRIRDLRAGSGPFALQFRSTAPSGDELGVALDWMEVRGARRVWPRRGLLFRLGVLFLGVPLLAFALLGSIPAIAAGLSLLFLGPTAVFLDRFGGLLALGDAAGPAFRATLALAFVAWLASRRRAIGESAAPAAVVLVLVALVALSHPFFYYPDVDTHARFLDAIRMDPRVAFDPTPYQERTGAWTRDVGGRRIAFPYSPVFHLLSLVLGAGFDSVAAVKTLAAAAFGASVLAVYVLGRSLGLHASWAIVAQGLFGLLPVVSSRLTLALFPALLAQALELWLVIFLVGWMDDPRRPVGPLACALFLVQLAYTGSLFTASSLVGVLTLWLLATGHPRRALRLALAQALAAGVVVVVLYARFVPRLLHDVLPHGGTGGAAISWAAPFVRFDVFYTPAHTALVLVGILSLANAPSWPRRVLLSMLAAGLGLWVGRYAFPGLLRDVKEMELIAGPIAILAAAGSSWLCARGPTLRVLALAALGFAVTLGLARGTASYRERFVAVGRVGNESAEPARRP